MPVVCNAGQQTATGVTLTVPAGDVPPAGDAPLEGLLVVESEHKGTPLRSGYPLRLAAQPLAPAIQNLSLMTALVFAFLGGLILNIMPCVLPVLSIKILGFVREAGANQRRLTITAWSTLPACWPVLPCWRRSC